MKQSTNLGTNYVGTPNELSWCVADAVKCAAFANQWNFHVDLVKEDDVSRYSFLYYLDEWSGQAKSGDITAGIFTSSGHGSQSYSLDEPDHYREVLYFNDGVVYDYEVRKYLDRLPADFPNLFFLDHCFSGGMSRFMGKDKIRFVPPQVKIPATATPIRFLRAYPGNEVFISACGENEYSYDAWDLQNGAGTYWLLNSFNENQTFQQWYNKIRTHLPSEQYPQTPSLQALNENKEKVFKVWFADPISSGIEDIPSSEQADTPVKLSFWQKVWNWIQKLFGYEKI